MWAAKDDGKGLLENDAKTYCENFNDGGYTDWRMPTADELASIYNFYAKNRHGYKVTVLIEITDEWIWASGFWGGNEAFSFLQGRLHGYPNPPGVFRRTLPVRAVKYKTTALLLPKKK